MSDYNHIYKKLVKGPNDVVGALAYALYKEEKIAYINQFTQEHQREPADEDLKAFHRMTNVEQRIRRATHPVLPGSGRKAAAKLS